MLYSGTGPESYITKFTLEYEDPESYITKFTLVYQETREARGAPPTNTNVESEERLNTKVTSVNLKSHSGKQSGVSKRATEREA